MRCGSAEFEAAADQFRLWIERRRRCDPAAGPLPEELAASGDARGQGLERLKDSWEEASKPVSR
jgi:hypothetical protein